MNNHHDILRELDAYAEALGVEASTVCRKATGNPRLHDRLRNRIERLETDVERLRKFMASNPPSETAEVPCPSTSIIDDINNVKGET